ncbi:Rne/Rng family ribonuclease [Alphaproteobacteria bacterium]|nr:Rne/Rng family ribonuclease [Alphaproteobacteria bacterium]
MSKRILIDASKADETRVAVTSNGKLDDYEIETGKINAVKGDVYLAKITRVEPSLQAAFVDFGANRNGFLPLTEIHPDYFKIPIADQDKISELLKEINSADENIDNQENEQEINEEIDELENNIDVSDKNNDSDEGELKQKKKNIKKKDTKKNYVNFFRKYKIQDVIKPRQVILVQINKEERGFKGAALTTFLSFAGRYCVLMPNSLNNDGISRKIGDLEERKKLKTILSSVNVPSNMSVIVRTAGIGKTKREIAKDLNFLTTQWNKIRENTLKSEAPKLIYEEGNIINRVIRDMLTEDVDEVLIDGKKGHDLAKKLTKNIVPNKLKNIKIFKEKDKSLFGSNNIESQVNELFSLTVKLESGGSIVINTTEALVAIDVNSGKNTSERNIENTALKTNLEAAVEVARQLRLRDLGGLVVIDFIDMDDYRNNFKVEKTIKTALYRDRARVQIGRIRDIEINKEGEIYLIADEPNTALFKLSP